jgi:hypothetical protein
MGSTSRRSPISFLTGRFCIREHILRLPPVADAAPQSGSRQPDHRHWFGCNGPGFARFQERGTRQSASVKETPMLHGLPEHATTRARFRRPLTSCAIESCLRSGDAAVIWNPCCSA